MSLTVLLGAVEQGFIYALVALGLYISYRTLDIADLSTDGTFVLGAACSATLTVAGHPLLGLFAALAAGARRVLLLQTDKGGLHSSPARPGRRRVEQAVRAAQVSPRDAVWHNIAQEIRKK